MAAWENKAAAQQTWAKLQTYFAKKWLECKQYFATTAMQSRFNEAALLPQVTAAAEDKGELQAMLFAMLHEQHNEVEGNPGNCCNLYLKLPVIKVTASFTI